MNIKTIVITGATSGMGFAAAKVLASVGHNVIGIGRDQIRCQQAAEKIKEENPDANIRYLVYDLSSMENIRKIADDIKKLTIENNYEAIDVLINNAATVTSWFTQTNEGIEMQFAVNHLAPFLLSHLLLPLLEKSTDSRIITVSSRSHRNMRMNWKDLMFKKRYGVLQAYKQSKLANVLFTREFNRRSKKARAFSVDPGLVKTEIGMKNTSGIVNVFWKNRMQKGQTPLAGAETIIYLAQTEFLPETEESNFKFLRPLPTSRYSYNIEHGSRLWAVSEKFCGISSADFGLKEVPVND